MRCGLERRQLRDALAARGLAATIWWQAEDGAPRAMAGAGEAYPATVFEQVHPAMGDRVRALALTALGAVAGRHVWDLYAGIGETTAALARAGASVESVESDRRAVAEAERRGPPARRHAARVEHVLGELRRPDLVITNPPRTGMDARIPDALERLRPSRVVYVSCDPATLARDLSRLPGFRLSEVQAFDLFPADRPRRDRRRAGPRLVKYIVSVLGREVEVEVDGDRVTVGGRTLIASLTGSGAPVRQLLVDGRSESMAAEAAGGGRWTITRRGDRWDLEVVDERTRYIRGLAGSGDKARGLAALKAPMPGLVVRVQVEAGATVSTGAGLVVLEAMKMENELRATTAGTVRVVRVRPGEAVEKGQVLVEFD